MRGEGGRLISDVGLTGRLNLVCRVSSYGVALWRTCCFLVRRDVPRG